MCEKDSENNEKEGEYSVEYREKKQFWTNVFYSGISKPWVKKYDIKNDKNINE